MGLFSFFDDERVVSVGGGVSRVREDALVRNSTGLVVAAATINNQDITEAILLNELTGTKSSYKQFNRISDRSSTIGLPETTFTYSDINVDDIAAAIQADILQTYPLGEDIDTTTLKSGELSSYNHAQYVLQDTHYYNVSTNTFTYDGSDWSLDNVTDVFSGDTHVGYIIDGIKDSGDTVSFLLSYPKPSDTRDIPALDVNGNPIVLEVPLYYWTIYYTHSGRIYIWIKDTQTAVFAETEKSVDISTSPELQFAPVVAIRNDKVNIDSGAAYLEAKRALRLVGLDPKLLNEQITQPEVEDVYVSLFSNLISEHMDQLAYNYAFFDFMKTFEVVTENTSRDLMNNSLYYDFNRLSVTQSSVYSNDTSWNYIQKTEGIVGVLSAEYEYDLYNPLKVVDGIETPSPVVNWVTNTEVCVYTIRKRITDTTYDELVVYNLATMYTVFASAGDVKAFSVDMTLANATQLVIPFSYVIADSIPRKYLETLYLRCTHLGLFSKKVVVLEWYEQEWFTDLIFIGSLALALISGPEIIAALEFEALGLLATTTLTFEIALIITAARYIVTQYALKAIFTRLLKTDSGFLKALSTVLYVVISIKFATNNVSLPKQLLAGFNSLMDVEKMLLQNEYRSFEEKQQETEQLFAELDALNKEFKQELANQINAQQALDIFNLFKNLGEDIVTQTDIAEYDQKADISEQVDMISSFVTNSLKQLTPPILINESERLLAA